MILWLLICDLLAAPLQEDIGQGYVDWTRGVLVLTAWGTQSPGAPRALELTEQQALNELQRRVQVEQRLIRLSRGQTVGERMQQGDAIAGMLLDSSGNFIIAEARYFSSGRVELTAELPLHGWLRPALVEQAKAEKGGKPGVYTGVVIDARGLSLRPSLAPRVLDGDDTLLYGLPSLTPQVAGDILPVAWVGDPADPEAVARAGDHPLFLQARAAARGDLVLSDGAAAELLRATQGTPLLAQARVVVVADQ